MDDLLRLGATEVIPEEFETSVEIFPHVLRRVPRSGTPVTEARRV